MMRGGLKRDSSPRAQDHRLPFSLSSFFIFIFFKPKRRKNDGDSKGHQDGRMGRTKGEKEKKKREKKQREEEEEE